MGRPGRRPVRLTRRGRVVLLGLCMILVGVVAALVAPASQAADPSEPAVAVVRPGDTLWSVAERHLPSRDAYGTIKEIRQLNGLSGHTIHPGQRLALPDGR